MRKLLLFCYLITSVTAFGQNLICEERGHLCGDVFFSTLMYCPPYVEDYEDSTITVYPACNTITYDCSRCGERVSELEKEKRIVTWKRKIIETDPPLHTIQIAEIIKNPKSYVNLHDTDLIICTENDKEETIQQYVDRHLSESAIRLWGEYETYCYDDSTYTHIYNPTWADWHTCYQQSGNLAHGYHWKLICNNKSHFSYIHKEPTFKGFIGYLKTKRK